MRLLLIVISMMVVSNASAGWYESKSIDWWVVVYSKMECSKASALGKQLHPTLLINEQKCKYEPENSTENSIASIGCDDEKGTGVVFAASKDACESYVNFLKEPPK